LDRAIANVDGALTLIEEMGASPWLVRHHQLVAEAAGELCSALTESHGEVIDAVEVTVGAALHDVGKIEFPNEMMEPGNRHESAGRRLLLAKGVSDQFARHCELHSSWGEADELEPLLVALADKLWKGKRVPALEERVVMRLAAVVGVGFWDAYPPSTELFDEIASRGSERLKRSDV